MSSPSWLGRSTEYRRGYGAGYRAGLRSTERTEGARRSWTRGVRWRDGEPEMRCDSCAAKGGGTSVYWPLTAEFWIRGNAWACRACLADRKRADAKARYAANPIAHRQRTKAYQSLVEVKAARRIKWKERQVRRALAAA